MNPTIRRRLDAIEAARPPVVERRTKAERDADLAAWTPAEMQAYADSLAGQENAGRRAAVLAAMRADT